MKKIALSLLVIAASGAYVWDQAGQRPANDPLDASLMDSTSLLPVEEPAMAVEPATPLRNPEPATQPIALPVPRFRAPAIEPTPPAAVQPMPRPSFRTEPATVTYAAMTRVAGSQFADGAYTGPATDAYYGTIQIQAIVEGGRLTGLKVLQYPNDRRTSIAINRQALPMLRDEAVAAQSADVDIITGATLTSRAFIRSLAGALSQAR